MKKISLITVYNNQELLEHMVASTGKQINVNIDYVLIDNREKAFSSAAAALNYGLEQVQGDVIIFLHQDIEFLSEDAVEKIYDFAMQNKNVIFGAAGVKRRYKKSDKIDILSSMYAGKEKINYTSLSGEADCFTLDECLIACYRECMNGLSFDEVVCDGWHLYGADLCLQAIVHKDLSVMVIPMDYVWHKSGGNADKSYRLTQDKLAKKYRRNFKIINTTNGFQYTGAFNRGLMNLYRKLKYGF